MNQQEAIETLQTIKDIYPNFVISKRKAAILLPELQKMDHALVMKKHLPMQRVIPTRQRLPKSLLTLLSIITTWKTFVYGGRKQQWYLQRLNNDFIKQ
ncbi:hypothetical protein WMZ97_09670 [Lentibacillus sp. N15]|uniref:hypothetical protein n=1 Tax=Lentibacillus songyuanensis TaxID=3136161 RepID=UPI0031B9D662